MNLLFFFYPLYVCLLPLRDVLEIVIIRRGSCGGKGEEKDGGGTSGQGHSSEA
ncbi:hypothetical protein AAHE18_11G127000 [Arachis hypogaea]